MKLYDAGFFASRGEVLELLDAIIDETIKARDYQVNLLVIRSLREEVACLAPKLHVSPEPDLPQYVRNPHD